MVRNIIYLPDGTEVSSGIKSSSLVRCVNSGEELTIGSTCANKAEFTLFDAGGKLSVDAGQEITVYRDDGETRKKLGVYVLEKPSRHTANTIKLVGYDRVIKLEKDLTNWLDGLTGWPYTPIQLAQMVCSECGVVFTTSSAPNDDFPINQFKKQGVTGRVVMQWLAEICCRFCRADADGNIEFAWYTPSNVTIRATGDRYIFGNGLSYKTFTTSPIDAVQIRLADSASGALWPTVEAENPYIITGNAIINRVYEGLAPYLDVIREQLQGITYTPCEVCIPACLDVDVGNTVSIADRNGHAISVYVMEKQTTGQKDIIRCKGSAKRPTETGDFDDAYQAVKDLDDQLDSYGVWKRLTNDGQKQGIYFENDQLYINGAFIKADTFQADAIKLLTGENSYLYFDSVESLNAFVESVAPTLKEHTQKVYSATCDFDPYYSYGIITMSRGIASDHFPEIVVELSVDGRLLYRWAHSDGSGGDGVYDPEDFYWAKPGGGVDNGVWTEVYADKDAIVKHLAAKNPHNITLAMLDGVHQDEFTDHKRYVDDLVAGYLPLSGGTLTGNLNGTNEYLQGSLYVGGKKSTTDGKTGVAFGKSGNITMQGSTAPTLAFITGTETSAKAKIAANTAGALNIYGANSITLYPTIDGSPAGGVEVLVSDASTQCLRPPSLSAGIITLGQDGRRFKTAYFTTAASVSSDRNLKENVQDIGDKYADLFKRLNPVSYKLIGNNHDRIHLGFISQEVKAAMDEVGLTDLDFGGFCRDVKRDPETDEPILDENGQPEYAYSLRYEEFIALNSKMIQIQQEQIKAQQEKIDALESKLQELTAKVDSALNKAVI